MILESAIINITKKLEEICNEDGRGISSHTDLKEKGLRVLLSLIQKAPSSEYRLLLQSETCEIILGFLLHVLCRLAKDDRSREIRVLSLEVMEALLESLGKFHPPAGPLHQPGPTSTPEPDTASNPPAAIDHGIEECSIRSFVIAIPGVTSALFKLIVEDIKAPKQLLISSVRTLAKFLSVAFLDCDHESKHVSGDLMAKLEGQNLITTCDNLAIRIGHLVSYISNHQDELPKEVLHEVLKLFQAIVKIRRHELLTRTLKSIIRYSALIKSAVDTFNSSAKCEIQLQLMLIFDNIKARLQEDNDGGLQLDCVIYSSLDKIIYSLNNQGLQMLTSERYSQLSMLSGLFMLLPEDTLTSYFEVIDKRQKLLNIFFQLTEFKTHQPLLFLTDSSIGDKALESRHENVYMFEKQFAHLTDKEVKSISECCQIIGQTLDWLFLDDLFRVELVQFESPSTLFITNLLLKGCQQRSSIGSNPHAFTCYMIGRYIDNIGEEYTNLKTGEGEIYSCDILKLVIAIETVATLIEIHLKFIPPSNQSRRIVVLKDLVCPLLNWCSSNGRAISEAALNTLTQISLSYGFQSVKSFIEQYVDYIVDGCCRMLDSFAYNTEATNVLAITFKLSSIETFYYFKDIYEKIFRLMSVYHFTDKSKPIVLLFYRTLTILNEWKEAKNDHQKESSHAFSLSDNSTILKILHGLDIDRRIENLRQASTVDDDASNLFKETDQAQEEQKLIDEIKSGKLPEDVAMDEEAGEDRSKVKSADVWLAEKIIKQCVGLMSSHIEQTKILAMKTTACGFQLLKDDEDTLLPLVHQVWSVLIHRLKGDYKQNLEVNLCAFECLISMASSSKDFIKDRTLKEIIPKLCFFLESQANQSKGKKDYDPYCMTLAFKCQLRILHNIGELAYHIELNYDCLWRIIAVAIDYLDLDQANSLREASKRSLNYMIALDADCVWYYAKQKDHLDELPLGKIFVL